MGEINQAKLWDQRERSQALRVQLTSLNTKWILTKNGINNYSLRFDAAIAIIATIMTTTTPPITALLITTSFVTTF